MRLILSLMLGMVIQGLLIACTAGPENEDPKKIVILAGEKSHPATMHEYLKNARLIRVMLENAADIGPLNTEIHDHGWPEDPATLDNADLILTISDGRDGPNGLGVPFMTDERMAIIEKQIERGCGFMTFHYSTFAPDRYGEEMLEWSGGYFDWQNDAGEREWYSAIKFLEVEVELPDSGHPVLNGVQPFRIYEEYYYNMRFRAEDSRLSPVVRVPELRSERKWGDVVAWAVEREDGGRGFGTTLGHLYANWKNEDYRKLLLNAVAWTAGIGIPEGGIDSPFYDHREVTRILYGKPYQALILTGNDHPAHAWRETVPVLKEALEKNGQVHVDVSENINDLFQYDLRDYDFLAFSYANWEDPDPLWEGSKKALLDYVASGGSLMFVHFANGAFHHSLPGAGDSDWPAWRELCRRVWDHSLPSSHDQHGAFEVMVVDTEHELTHGIDPFTIRDELYYHQAGTEPIHVLLSAVSTDTGEEAPLAWTYELDRYAGKKARVFQTVLGHDAEAMATPELTEILSRASVWLARGTSRWNDL